LTLIRSFATILLFPAVRLKKDSYKGYDCIPDVYRKAQPVSRERNVLHTATDRPQAQNARLGSLKGLIELFDMPALLSDRGGTIVAANQLARSYLNGAISAHPVPNLFCDLLRVDAPVILGQLENGEAAAVAQIESARGTLRVKLQLLPDTEWLVVRLEPQEIGQGEPSAGAQATVQALLQEREITYRNLLAAYLRLQEVNRQKTVFLASAAHELKTPLAVIKGYYDLLLSSSLGDLNEKQRDILQESKDSCERLVRLVSMFLNYSALESGKLLLHSRENDPKDCLSEVAARWQEAFQRKHVRLEVALESELPCFRFDYQKVQQVVANLLDNALKHTPSGGTVSLSATNHFWERRANPQAPSADRRQARSQAPNSVRIAVADTGAGIAAEHHQEIFEDFVRVDRTSSGMGLGLAIAHRLVQAHRGKIWVDSELHRGCTFSVLLPTDTA
jgi:signal transduction histidine kinase